MAVPTPLRVVVAEDGMGAVEAASPEVAPLAPPPVGWAGSFLM
jgi:hypothetical protein